VLGVERDRGGHIVDEVANGHHLHENPHPPGTSPGEDCPSGNEQKKERPWVDDLGSSQAGGGSSTGATRADP
jgi:hypothetical protein